MSKEMKKDEKSESVFVYNDISDLIEFISKKGIEWNKSVVRAAKDFSEEFMFNQCIINVPFEKLEKDDQATYKFIQKELERWFIFRTEISFNDLGKAIYELIKTEDYMFQDLLRSIIYFNISHQLNFE